MTRNCFFFSLEPVMLNGEGEYNLNDLLDIEVSDSFLGLEQDIKGCQNDEPFHNCTTKHYIEKVQNQCGCLPLNLMISNKVKQNFHFN